MEVPKTRTPKKSDLTDSKPVSKSDAKPLDNKNKRAEIARRYYVRKTLLKGKVPRNLKEEDVKSDKLERLNQILNRIKNEKKVVDSEDDEDDDEDEEMEDEEVESKPTPHKASAVTKSVSNKSQVYNKDDIISRLDALNDMVMYLVEKSEKEDDDVEEEDEDADDEEEDEEEEEDVNESKYNDLKKKYDALKANVSPNQKLIHTSSGMPLRICFAG